MSVVTAATESWHNMGGGHLATKDKNALLPFVFLTASSSIDCFGQTLATADAVDRKEGYTS